MEVLMSGLDGYLSGCVGFVVLILGLSILGALSLGIALGLDMFLDVTPATSFNRTQSTPIENIRN
jgi:hypothetical protein